MPALMSLLLSLACLVSACAGGSSGGMIGLTPVVASQSPASAASAPAYVYAGTLARDKSIASKITGITYPYHVYLPENYATSGKSYPVMYATDGQWSFRAFSRMLDQHRKAMILVSIEQGGPEPDRRAVDYSVNGAPAYARFLREELVPLIEASYRTTEVRTYTGTSYGALLGSVMLSTEDVAKPFFSNYLLFDGSFWALTAKNIQDEDARFAASSRLAVHLILTSANAPGNVRDVIDYEARYKARAFMGLRIDRKDFNVAHNDVGKPSFDWAIDLIE